MAPMVFAHQGGWDEILFALTPVLVVAAILALANRRANALQKVTLAAGVTPADDEKAGPSTGPADV